MEHMNSSLLHEKNVFNSPDLLAENRQNLIRLKGSNVSRNSFMSFLDHQIM